MGGDFEATVNLHVLDRFPPRNLLQFSAWDILGKGVDACNLECSCNSVISVKCSEYHFERESQL